MQATQWEFKNRAMIFGMIIGFAFPFYILDRQTSSAVLAEWLGAWWHKNPDILFRLLLGGAALLQAVAAWLRTWASAYLHTDVVYASEVKTQSVVADGPYRHVRNPLYVANILMAISMGAMMSRVGFIVAVAAMWIFCYRLIRREEAELQANQGESYQRYRNAVPRLLPSPWPRVASAGRQAQWDQGFKAEMWFWGFAAAIAGFALSLNIGVFFAILGASLAWFWIYSSLLEKKAKAQASTSEGKQ